MMRSVTASSLVTLGSTSQILSRIMRRPETSLIRKRRWPPTSSGLMCSNECDALFHAVDVHAALVRKGAVADIRFAIGERHVGDDGHMARHVDDVRYWSGRQTLVVALDAKIGDDRRQVGVAAALAETDVGALDVPRTVLDSRHAVRHRHTGIVVRMDADRDREQAADLADDVGDLRWESAAIGVAQHEHIGAAIDRRLQRFHGVGRVVLVAVEEMLGVIDNFLALRLKASVSLIIARFSSSVVRMMSVTWKSQLLPKMTMTGVSASNSDCTLLSLDLDVAPARAAEGGQLGVLQRDRRARAKNSRSFGLEPGLPASI